jgi:hypothetical protein
MYLLVDRIKIPQIERKKKVINHISLFNEKKKREGILFLEMNKTKQERLIICRY